MPLGRRPMLVDVHAVAPQVLGRIAGDIGRGQQVLDALGFLVDRDQADRRADLESRILRHEAVIPDGQAHVVGDLDSALQRALLEQHAELVTAEARNGIRAPHHPADQGRDLLKQLVAGGVSAGVVDDLELVEIDVQQHV
jgi:hypothetical protein